MVIVMRPGYEKMCAACNHLAYDRAVSPLEELSDLLTSIGRQTHSQRLYADMATRAGVNIRPYLLTTLARLRELQPVRVSDVADDMDSDRSTVSRHLTELTALGCVERRADPDDGRAVVLSLTPLGEEVIARTFAAWLGALGDMTGDWSDRDLVRLVSLLRRLDG